MPNSKPSPEKSSKSPSHGTPFIFSPELQHKQTIIILHGRHNNGKTFGQGMLSCDIPGVGTLPKAFPHAKFIFPSAPTRPAILYGNAGLIQWFDNWFLDDPIEREEVMIEGLHETSEYVHELLRVEIKAVGAPNVILGGLSQGCAVTLVSLLTWPGEPIAAAVGMSGWLPFSVPMTSILKPSRPNKGARAPKDSEGTSNEDPLSSSEQAISYLHRVLNNPTTNSPQMGFQKTPFFLGHGEADDKVYFYLGQRATACLQDLGADARFCGYQYLHHWYSKEMLGDIVQFIKANTSW